MATLIILISPSNEAYLHVSLGNLVANFISDFSSLNLSTSTPFLLGETRRVLLLNVQLSNGDDQQVI